MMLVPIQFEQNHTPHNLMQGIKEFQVSGISLQIFFKQVVQYDFRATSAYPYLSSWRKIGKIQDFLLANLGQCALEVSERGGRYRHQKAFGATIPYQTSQALPNHTESQVQKVKEGQDLTVLLFWKGKCACSCFYILPQDFLGVGTVAPTR